MTNSADLDEITLEGVSDLALHCLPRSVRNLCSTEEMFGHYFERIFFVQNSLLCIYMFGRYFSAAHKIWKIFSEFTGDSFCHQSRDCNSKKNPSRKHVCVVYTPSNPTFI